jgi:hypothetical protein
VLIDRRKLDVLLRESAIDAGATLLSSVSAFTPGKNSWIIASNDAGPIRCRFLVNAAGRHSALRDGRVIHSPRTIALTVRLAASSLGDAESRVEAAANSWFWAVRSQDANASVTLFVALETAQQWQRTDRSAELLRCLGKTSLRTSRIRLRLSSRICALDATITAERQVFGDRMVHIGDAALALDPIASQGIHHALLSAQQAGAAINTVLVRGQVGLARRFLNERQQEARRQHLSACVAVYQQQDIFDTPFWRERSEPASPVLPELPSEPSLDAGELLVTQFVLCPEVRWEILPVLVGDFIEWQSALCHPGLSRPIAYLENQLLNDLLADLPAGFSGLSLLRRWMEIGLPVAEALRAFVFLVRHRVLAARSGNSSQPRGREEAHLILRASPARLGRLLRR